MAVALAVKVLDWRGTKLEIGRLPGVLHAGTMPEAVSYRRFIFQDGNSTTRRNAAAKASAVLGPTSNSLVVERFYITFIVSKPPPKNATPQIAGPVLPHPPPPLAAAALPTAPRLIRVKLPQPTAHPALYTPTPTLPSPNPRNLPVVYLSAPNTLSSATFPPILTSMSAISCCRVVWYSSYDWSCDTMPNACPRGTIVAL